MLEFWRGKSGPGSFRQRVLGYHAAWGKSDTQELIQAISKGQEH